MLWEQVVYQSRVDIAIAIPINFNLFKDKRIILKVNVDSLLLRNDV